MKKILWIFVLVLLMSNNVEAASISEELTQLNNLFKEGAITKEEFSKAKSILLKTDNKNEQSQTKKGSKFSKLTLFQKPGIKFFKPCPLSGKDAPVLDYKNTKLLRKYISESGRILPSRITSVSQGKQRELSKAIKRARLLALL